MERPTKRGRVREILRPGGAHNDDRGALQPAAHIGQQPQTHLVRPVDVFEHEHQPLTHGEALDDLGDALEELTIVYGPDFELVLRPAELGKEPAESGAVERCESGEGIIHWMQVRGAERVDPRPQR